MAIFEIGTHDVSVAFRKRAVRFVDLSSFDCMVYLQFEVLELELQRRVHPPVNYQSCLRRLHH